MSERNPLIDDRRRVEPPKAERKLFVKPELKRQAKLPEVTNSFIGSFTP